MAWKGNEIQGMTWHGMEGKGKARNCMERKGTSWHGKTRHVLERKVLGLGLGHYFKFCGWLFIDCVN
jgi:hypothetical protein